MKHLNEDELLMAAFDEAEEMSLDDLDQEQRREFAALSGLKLDLKKLNDIPPCQLSSERLRRHILEDGIQSQRKNRTGWFVFASAGAASCACMALAALMIWNWYQPSIQSSKSILAERSQPSPSLEQEQPKIETEASEPAPTTAPVLDANSGPRIGAARASQPRRSRPARSPRRPSMTTVAMAMDQPGYAIRSQDDPAHKESAPAPEMIDSMPAAMTVPAASPELPGSPSSPVTGGKPSVIIIGQAPGQQPPAVESSGHVVFGG